MCSSDLIYYMYRNAFDQAAALAEKKMRLFQCVDEPVHIA